MLSARITRNIAVFLVVFLAGMLIFTAVASAHHVRDSGRIGSVQWSLGVGKFDWDSTYSCSWHYHHFYNTSTTQSYTVEWWWTHVVKKDNGSTHRTTGLSGEVTLEPAPDDVEEADPEDPDPPEYPSELREQSLYTNISDLDEGWYYIEASVEFSVKNNNGQNIGSDSVESSSDDFWVN